MGSGQLRIHLHLHLHLQSFRQHLPIKSMAHTQGIWNFTTDRHCHQELRQQLQVHSGRKQRIQLRCEDRRCSSTWPLTGRCSKQHRTDHGASDGPFSQPLKIWKFAGDLVLVTHNHQYMQEKTTRLNMSAQVMMLNNNNVLNPSPVKVKGEDHPVQQPKNSPTSVVLKCMIAEQASTSGIASTSSATPSEC